MIRRILVDRARHRQAEKRGGTMTFITMTNSLEAGQGRAVELIALDDALEALSLLDPIQSKVVELRFFGGLSVAETAWWGGTGRRLGFGCCARCSAKDKWPNSR